MGLCFPICIVTAAHAASCMLNFVCMWSCGGLQMVSVPSSFRPVWYVVLCVHAFFRCPPVSELSSLFLSFLVFGLSMLYERGVVCRRMLSHLHCIRGACGVTCVEICVHVVFWRPAACKCFSLFLSCLVRVVLRV